MKNAPREFNAMEKIHPPHEVIIKMEKDFEMDAMGELFNCPKFGEHPETKIKDEADEELLIPLRYEAVSSEKDSVSIPAPNAVKNRSNRQYMCYLCKNSYTRITGVRNHMPAHTGNKLFKCTLCSKSFATMQQLGDHLRGHNNVRPHKCTQCDKSYIRTSHLTEHLLSHTHQKSGEKHFKCTMCDRSYNSRGKLNLHIRKHTGERNIKCTECDASFYDPGCLTQHKKNIHSYLKPFKCSTCGQDFRREAYLKYHMKQHMEKKPANKSTVRKNTVTKEILKKQSKRKPSYICAECHRSLSSKRSLDAHMRIHKGDVGNSTCTFCNATFFNEHRLKLHLKNEICEKIYLQNQGLAEISPVTPGTIIVIKQEMDHMLDDYNNINLISNGIKLENDVDVGEELRTGQDHHANLPSTSTTGIFATESKQGLSNRKHKKRYNCTECHRSFLNLASYQSHVKVPHNNGSFICKRCHQKFTFKGKLKRHIANKTCVKNSVLSRTNSLTTK